MKLLSLTLITLSLTGCGIVNKAIDNTKDQFHLNGPELMEVIECQWSVVDTNGETIIASLKKSFYSDGYSDNECSANHISGFIELNCLTVSDAAVVFYFTSHSTHSFTDTGNCSKTFY